MDIKLVYTIKKCLYTFMRASTISILKNCISKKCCKEEESNREREREKKEY